MAVRVRDQHALQGAGRPVEVAGIRRLTGVGEVEIHIVRRGQHGVEVLGRRDPDRRR